jgi:Domain of unknown function (DUF4120)
MKTRFETGTKVKFNLPDGASARIVRYERECFYVVDVEHVQGVTRTLIAHEDDLILDDEELYKALDFSRCQEYFHSVVTWAKDHGKWTGPNGLHTNLTRLLNIAGKGKKAFLYKDFAPNSFEFQAGGFVGGLIFHGKHDNGGDGGAPTLSVNLEPVDGWILHT